MNPTEFAKELGVEFVGTKMVAGVEIAEFQDNDDDLTYYTLVYPDGNVDTMRLSEVYKDGNYTKGKTVQGNMEVMLDDNGVHDHWD